MTPSLLPVKSLCLGCPIYPMRTEAGSAGSHLEIDGLAQFWVPPLLEGRIGRQRNDAGLTFESWELLRSWKPMGKYGSKKHDVFVIYLPNSLTYTYIYIYGLVSGGLVQCCLVVLEFFSPCAILFRWLLWNDDQPLEQSQGAAPVHQGFLAVQKGLVLGIPGTTPPKQNGISFGVTFCGPITP